jgi:flavin-dependent dehydrogenase
VTGAVDVLILGGGPAGSAAANQVARSGWNVVVVESTRYDDLRVGETLAPRATSLLAQLSLPRTPWTHEHVSSPGMVTIWGDDAPQCHDFITNPTGGGWHVDRCRFDRLLAAEARQQGACVLENATAIGYVRSDAGWRTQVLHEQETKELSCRFLIDATGRRKSHFKDRAGGRATYDRLVAIAAIGASSSVEDPDHRTMIEATAWGWWYCARLPGERAIAVFFTDSDLMRGGQAAVRAYLLERLRDAPHVRRRVELLVRAATIRVWPAMTCRNESVTGADWLLAGDAAMTWDPLSGQGICNALESGMKAGTAVDAALRGDDAPLNAYSKWMQERFKQYVTARYRYYSAEQRWPQSPFWQRRHAVH